MPIHIVNQGECVSRIAYQYGYRDYTRIYEHPNNAELRQKRPDPNLLFPGDKLFIPEVIEKTEVCVTGQKHVFRTMRPLRWLRVALEEEDNSRLANRPYELVIDGSRFSGLTSSQGLIEHRISMNAERGTLQVDGKSWELAVAHLNPVGKATPDGGVSGAQGRLRNLGYPVGAIDGILGPKTKTAIRWFQADEGLPAIGELSERTCMKLVEVHGY
jgi:Putative peptidoglycan binding domain